MRLSDNLISAFNRVFAPTPFGHGKDRRHFKGPMLEVTAVIHNIHVNQAMGIAPVEGRHGSSKDDGLLHVIVRHAVVRGCRA